MPLTFTGPVLVATHFDWSEVLRTTHRDRALENVEYLKQRPEIAENVRTLVRELLEPIRVQLGPVVIHSWLRCPALNRDVGGSPTSQHLVGSAADLHVPGRSLEYVVDWIEGSGLPFHQVLLEPLGAGPNGWVHVGAYVRGAARNSQVLR